MEEKPSKCHIRKVNENAAIFQTLDIPLGGSGDDHFWADELYVSTIESQAGQGSLTGRTHFAFQAQSKEMVEAFYQAGLKAGGKDNGAPGIRQYHPGYFAAFLIDPDGNKIEAVYHGPAKKSANSIKITF